MAPPPPLTDAALSSWSSGFDGRRAALVAALTECCRCPSWAAAAAEALAAGAGPGGPLAAMREAWFGQTLAGWTEAFDAHPRIGEKKKAVGERERGEQAAAAGTMTSEVETELARLNDAYFEKFGIVFLICASGLSAPTILEELKRRIGNTPAVEFHNAAVEQMKITELRLSKLVEASTSGALTRVQPRLNDLRRHLVGAVGGGRAQGWAGVRGGGDTHHHTSATPTPAGGGDEAAAKAEPAPTANVGGAARSPITTHVLDTALGRPAKNLAIVLSRAPLNAGTIGRAPPASAYAVVGSGATNDDGRVGTLLAPGSPLQAAHYRIRFETGPYLLTNHGGTLAAADGIPFYPEVTVDFTVSPSQTNQHFHVPILLNPYGYSTYRGS